MAAPVEQHRGLPVNRELVAPIVVGLVAVISLFGLLQALGAISGWSTNYGSEATFDNDRCTSERLRLASRLTCTGQVTPVADPRPVPSTMVGPQAAFGESPPVGGEQVPVYFRTGDTSVVYPEGGKTTEFIRLLLGRLDSIFFVGGALAWLVGWYLTKDVPAEDAEFRQYRYRFHQRFGLRGLGVKWMLVGLGWWLFDRLVLDDLLGTVGLG